MQPAALVLEGRPLRPRGHGQSPLAPRRGPPRLPIEPSPEHVDVMEDSDGILQLLPGRAGPRFAAAHHVVHLGGVPQSADPPPQRMKRLRVVAPAHLGQAPEEHCTLPLAHLSGPLEDRERVGGAPGADPAEVLAKTVDVQVEYAVGQPASASAPRQPQTSQELPLLRRGCLEPAQPFLEEPHQHVEVTPRARGPRELAQDAPSALEAPAPGLAGQQRQSDPEASAGHPHLMDRLLLPGQGPGELAEETPHPLPQERGRTLVSGLGRGHQGCPTEAAENTTPRDSGAPR